MSQDPPAANSTPEAPGRAMLRLSASIQIVIFFCAFLPTLVMAGLAHRKLTRKEAQLQIELEREKAKRAAFAGAEPLAGEYKRLLEEMGLRLKLIGHFDSFRSNLHDAVRTLGAIFDRANDVRVTKISFADGINLHGVAKSEDAAKSFAARFDKAYGFSKVTLTPNPGAADGEFAFSIVCNYSLPLATGDQQNRVENQKAEESQK